MAPCDVVDELSIGRCGRRLRGLETKCEGWWLGIRRCFLRDLVLDDPLHPHERQDEGPAAGELETDPVAFDLISVDFEKPSFGQDDEFGGGGAGEADREDEEKKPGQAFAFVGQAPPAGRHVPGKSAGGACPTFCLRASH